jgi:hypothetical protein
VEAEMSRKYLDHVEVLISKLTKAISYKYREDKTAPGLTVSALKKGFYCSIVRYNGAFGAGKEIVCKAKSDSLLSALENVSQQFLDLATYPQDPIQELNQLVRSDNDS